jgi:four helix bundle protein
MAALESYRELEVWKKSIDLVERVYRLSGSFPQDERFGLTKQLRRAVVSVPANIAEGAARTGTGEFLRFLSFACGSLAEVETLLVLANRLEMIRSAELAEIQVSLTDVGKMLSGLKRALRSRSE